MRKKTVYRQAEAALARKSKRLAEYQLRLTTPQRLAAAITDYIEWRAFALWVRLIVEVQAGVSAEMRTLLNDRCPGFLDEAAAHSRAHPQEPANLWLRLISWLDREKFGFAHTEGWLHALGYCATRDPRMDQITDYWLQCNAGWMRKSPPVLPTFDQWRQQAASQTRP